MNILKYVVASTFFCAASGSAAPVPAAKSAYIGTWQGQDMQLTIAADGKISHQRAYTTKKRIDVEIALASFNGDDFDAGYGIFRSTFVVSKPPASVGDHVMMVVDCLELTR